MVRPPVIPGEVEIHRLDGSLRLAPSTPWAAPPTLTTCSCSANGDYLAGAYVTQGHVDTSAYGGSSDANVINAELQEVSPERPAGLGLEEPGPHLAGRDRAPLAVDRQPPEAGGYDIVHWNSIEPAGNSVIASFRHLDAVYKIDKSTGTIVWKLGGTKTPKSLTVKGDPRGYTFGAQHDARLLPDGTLTVFDNRTNQVRLTPNEVQYIAADDQRRDPRQPDECLAFAQFADVRDPRGDAAEDERPHQDVAADHPLRVRRGTAGCGRRASRGAAKQQPGRRQHQQRHGGVGQDRSAGRLVRRRQGDGDRHRGGERPEDQIALADAAMEREAVLARVRGRD